MAYFSGLTLRVESALSSFLLVVVILISPPVVFMLLELKRSSVVVDATATPADQSSWAFCHQADPVEGAFRARSEVNFKSILPVACNSALLKVTFADVLPVFMVAGNGDREVLMPYKAVSNNSLAAVTPSITLLLVELLLIMSEPIDADPVMVTSLANSCVLPVPVVLPT